MSWGNNNGNGQGQGLGYGYGSEDVYGRLNNTREIGGARFPFIEGGKHRLALVTLEEFPHRQDGPSARALFKVIESNKHTIGSYVVKIWKLVKPSKFDTQPSDGDKFADFCRKLKNAPSGFPIGDSIRTLMKERARDQLARGTVIDATGVTNQKGNWTEIYWAPVEGQTPELIAQMRQRIEVEGVPDTGGQARPPQQQGPQGGQYQNAPHPSQMPGQYPAQQAQVPVQYTPQNYAVATQSPYAQPQQQPQAAPPQGGFLAQLPPPNGQGPQGGNGGGGTW